MFDPSSLPGGPGAPPGIRRPRFAVGFRAGGAAGGGGLGGLAGAAAGALGLGGGGGEEDPWTRSLVSLTLEAGLAPLADSLEIRLSGDSRAPAVAVGDAGPVSLGYEDAEPVPVFTGVVDSVRRALDGTVRVGASNSGAALARHRVGRSFEQSTAGDVLRDLAGLVSADTGTVEDGVGLAFFAVDGRRGAYAQVAELARRSGYLAYVDRDGKLSFGPPPSGDPVATFHYAVDVLAMEALESAGEVGAVTVQGEGAAGSEGQDAWAWLVKDPASVRGQAGSGAPERSLSDPALRSSAAATGAATAIADAHGARRLRARLLVPGAPEVGVGSVVEVAGAPAAAMNGRFVVHGLRHRLSARTGFRTELTLAATGGGGGPGGALGGLL